VPLVLRHPRAVLMAETFFRRHAADLARVPAAGERVALVTSGNHCQGTIFRNGTHLVTEALERRIDEISRSIPGFYFGRFDIRFADLESFLQGDGFKIVEINGASAEATHIWDASVSLLDAYATLFEQFRMLFAIGAANRKRGSRPSGVIRFVRDVRSFRKLARSYPTTR